MRRNWLLATAVPVLALAVASLVSLPKKLIYNASASAPIGLYWLDNRPFERDNYVLVRVPERVGELVVERGYLPPDVPLLKRVVGLNGDRICRQSDEITVNGSVVASAKRRDGQGREMPDWHGCHILNERTVFLLQDHPHSFDGRYFGPVDRRLIIGRATRLRLPWRD
ncbi:S26 family signal peptidase [Pyruvatibacter mobilis]|uniref:S26 family signal peptidase n=1 Tax=Pyruvatibacter mobilis TaxID=1712261 RepID=UPI003BABFBCF